MKEKIFQDLKEAMRAQDVARRTTLRMVVAAIKNLEIETSSELESGDVLQIIQKQVKSRRESIEEFRKGNREDLIAKEQTEIDILKEYLPEEPRIYKSKAKNAQEAHECIRPTNVN